MPGRARVPRTAAALAGGLLLLLAAGACSGDDGGRAGSDGAAGDAPPADGDRAGPTLAGPTAADLCDGAVPAPDRALVQATDLDEASGLAASRRSPGVLWSHDDSGGDPVVFAIGADGADLGAFRVAGAEATDWEDLALGPGPGGAAPDLLYLGDIGDNRASRPSVTVYRAPEPTVAPLAVGSGETGGEITGAEALTLTYADGPHDAEALVADPVTGDLFVLTKEWPGRPVGAYRIPAGAGPDAPVEMARAGDVAVPSGELVTGADISPSGALIAVRTYGLVLLWDRAEDESVPEALAGEPCRAPVEAEAQGESVAVEPDGRGYVTVGEGLNQPVNVHRLP